MSRFFRAAGDSDSDTEDSEEELMSSGDENEAPKPTVPKPAGGGMSRFLRTAGSGSSSSSSSESEDEDDDEDDDHAQDSKKKGSKYMVGGSDEEESDEDVKRVVKSAKDKRLDEMEAAGKAMDNALKINDWVAISNEFDKLVRLVQRQTNVAEPVPSFYIKTLSSLEASLNNALAKEKESKKKMNASNAKALNGMKQKVRKISKEHESEIKEFQEDPEAFEKRHAIVVPEVEVAPKPKKSKRVLTEQEEEDEERPATDAFTTVGKGGKTMVFASENTFKNLQVVQEARGKKNTDRAEQVRILERVLEAASTSYQRIRVLLVLISSRFDYSPSATHMPIDQWALTQREVDQLVSIISADSHYFIEEEVPDYDELLERTPEAEGGLVRVRGSIISFVERLDDEFTKSLQNLDPHGTEYVDRLKDEKGLYETICRAEAYFELRSQSDPLSRVIMRRLEHIYSKPDAVVQALEAGLSGLPVKPATSLASENTSSGVVHALCVFLYKSGNSLFRTRAMLSHIYHHALHNQFYKARDMLLMSHLQESIHAADVATQILYNRTTVQLGLCAFRSGLIKEAQAILLEIFSTQHVKELLAQGVHYSRYTTVSPEQEKAERARQMPFHMHINTELLEAAFLVSSMLIEIPLLASIETEELKRKTISKPFRRLLDFADKQIFAGPPETTRDHIMQASKTLQDGQWEKCRDLIQSIKIWSLMPEEKEVKEMLAGRIQEEGLRTYLFTYAPHYKTLALSHLSETFSLSIRTVNSVVSKMIWNEELSASLDQASNVIVFHSAESTRTQQLAQSLADRVSNLVEQNEKTLDVRLGGGGWQERSDAPKTTKADGGAERKGRSERSRGGTPLRGTFLSLIVELFSLIDSSGGTRGGRGARFSQGLGNRMGPRVAA
ncbi:eukaryotic translation initiation factor 3 subunit 8 [Sistotremastrum niveocremeum HHB9708]|uniref:Eukaryotic translation initiation factor 3 subunit C n=2 Tax=Sistotremastraceae TaxID=3402574 RepID=A0A165A676_9AGAM|nr:eukaryotic translation initiation factor 3 subunit 8 [Sistotremastrum niveocremeum HHB9708]KZT43538.1 hypothetical protein SISSUDRAFT_978233 [Sistotremastrum suecicum HHB10207 ss-3]